MSKHWDFGTFKANERPVTPNGRNFWNSSCRLYAKSTKQSNQDGANEAYKRKMQSQNNQTTFPSRKKIKIMRLLASLAAIVSVHAFAQDTGIEIANFE